MPWLIISAYLYALVATQYRDLLSCNVIAFLRLALAYPLVVSNDVSYLTVHARLCVHACYIYQVLHNAYFVIVDRC